MVENDTVPALDISDAVTANDTDIDIPHAVANGFDRTGGRRDDRDAAPHGPRISNGEVRALVAIVAMRAAFIVENARALIEVYQIDQPAVLGKATLDRQTKCRGTLGSPRAVA